MDEARAHPAASWLHAVNAMAWAPMALLFVYAAAGKLRDPALFAESLRGLAFLKDPAPAWIALGLPWLEVLAVVYVLKSGSRLAGLTMMTTLMLIFTVLIAWVEQSGMHWDCGCFGADPVGVLDMLPPLLRNLLMLGLCVAGLFAQLRLQQQARNRSSLADV